jgi:hypothetical protein
MSGDPAFGAQDPPAQYSQQIQQALSSNNSFQSVAGELGGSSALQAGLGATQIDAAESQYGINNQATLLGNQYNSAMAGYQMGQLGISQQQLGLQGTGLAEQQQLLGTQSGIEAQQYGLQSQVFPEEQAEAALQYGNSQSQLQGSLAASGALNTKGSQQQQSTLAQQYGWQQADISRAQSLAGLGQQSTVAGEQYSQEELANAQQNLGLLASSNGMSQQEVGTQLQYMLDSGQLQGMENPIQLLNTIGQVNAGDLTGIENQISTAGFASGMNLFPGQSYAGASGPGSFAAG